MRPSCLAIVLWAALQAAPLARAQLERVTLDGSVHTTAGLTFSFSRPAPAHDRAGILLPPDEPRWAPPTLFCGQAPHETLAAGQSFNAIAAGHDADGATPLCVVNTPTLWRMSIHFGADSVDRAFRDGDWGPVFVRSYRDAYKGDTPNLLVGQRGYNGGSFDSPSHAFKPNNGGAVHRGLIVLGADVCERLNGEWTSTRAGLVFTTTQRLTGYDPWIVAALGEPTDPADSIRGSPWSLTPFPISDDELIVVWTDYRAYEKSGGVCYATRFLRSPEGWSHETIRVARSDHSLVHQHWHCGGLLKHPDGRLSILISVGDGVGDNHMLASTLAAGGAWSSGEPVPGSGLDLRSRVFLPSADWSPPAIVWGGLGFTPSLRHNQAISMIPADPDCSALLCGADETAAAILRLRYDPDTRQPEWRTLYLPAVTGWAGDGVLNFSMQGAPGGPYLGRIDAGSTTDWHAEDRETRVLFSPDGEHWGQCYTPRNAGSRQAVLVDGAAYLSAGPGDPEGLRRLGLPAHRLARPLALGRSQHNLLRRVVPIPTQRVDPGVSITRIVGPEGLPPGVPPPPCDAGNVFRIEVGQSTGKLGLWRPVSDAADVPAPREAALLRFWLYALLPEHEQHPRATVQVAARLGDTALEHLNRWSGRIDLDAGAWTPVAIWSPWEGPQDDAEPLAPGQAWRPEVYLRTDSNRSWNASQRFLIAWEGLYPDAPTVESVGLPPESSGASETATIDGLDLEDEWTVLLVGMVPDDQWDNRAGGNGPEGQLTRTTHAPTLCSLIDKRTGDARAIAADPRHEGLLVTTRIGEEVSQSRHDETVYWLRGSPVALLLRARGPVTTLDYAVGGADPARLTLDGIVTPTQIRLGPDAFWWHAVETLPYAISDQRAAVAFAELALSCRADFNRDDTVDSRDVIAYLNAWTAQRPEADLNGDGRVDTLDLVAFLDAYGQGC